MKFFIGPMTKNVVDAILESDCKMGFIPSRRQVEYDGGYVNNWTTKEFSHYVNGKTIIQRDHGGPGQGHKLDDGLKSFQHDAKYFDIVHIDPWKIKQDFEGGFEETLSFIKYIYWINKNIEFYKW